MTVKTIKKSFEDHARVMADAATVLPAILDRVAADLHACFARGNKLLACGNGGSASDAEHLVAELVGRYRDERRGLPAITLVSGSATVTALANDYGYDEIFARQVKAHGQKGDIAIAISTSGNSPNVLKGVEAAKACGLTTIGWTGHKGGKLAGLVDHAFVVPSTVTARIQESHMTLGHVLCELIEENLFGKIQ